MTARREIADLIESLGRPAKVAEAIKAFDSEAKLTAENVQKMKQMNHIPPKWHGHFRHLCGLQGVEVPATLAEPAFERTASEDGPSLETAKTA
jgi:hypothetical protein